MDKKEAKESTYREVFGDQLNTLVGQYVDKKNKEIEEYNKTAKKWKKTKRYSIHMFCDELSADGYELPYQNLIKYMNKKAIPKDPKLVFGLATKLGVTPEYLYGFTEVENTYVDSIKELLPLNDDSVQTIYRLMNDKKENEVAIKVLNALLTDYDVCREMFTFFYEGMYEKYKRDSIGIPVDNQAIQNSIQKKIYTTEYYENVISRLLLVSEKDIFDKRIENEKGEEYYQKNNKEEVVKEVIEVSDLFNEINYEEPFTATEIQNNKNTKHSKSKRLR